MAAMDGVKASAIEFSIEQRFDSQASKLEAPYRQVIRCSHSPSKQHPHATLFTGVEYIWTYPSKSCLFCKWSLTLYHPGDCAQPPNCLPVCGMLRYKSLVSRCQAVRFPPSHRFLKGIICSALYE